MNHKYVFECIDVQKAVGIKYDDDREMLIIGGNSKDADFIHDIVTEYFDVHVDDGSFNFERGGYACRYTICCTWNNFHSGISGLENHFTVNQVKSLVGFLPSN